MTGLALGPDIEAPFRGLIGKKAVIPVGFSETGGKVAVILHQLRQGKGGETGFVEDAARVGTDADLGGIHTEHHGIAAWDAHRALADALAEDDAVGGQLIDARCFDIGVKAAHTIPALLVGHNEDDIWLP